MFPISLKIWRAVCTHHTLLGALARSKLTDHSTHASHLTTPPGDRGKRLSTLHASTTMQTSTAHWHSAHQCDGSRRQARQQVAQGAHHCKDPRQRERLHAKYGAHQYDGSWQQGAPARRPRRVPSRRPMAAGTPARRARRTPARGAHAASTAHQHAGPRQQARQQIAHGVHQRAGSPQQAYQHADHAKHHTTAGASAR